jgi:hypothetical protein
MIFCSDSLEFLRKQEGYELPTDQAVGQISIWEEI